ncbi:UDP-glucuronic acid decarboxylase family protein [Nitrosococcus wardiae]|uniref:SDR family oxidoreductase n=1 Tax=Nitrosococcus wardiae TaxID=1814290 RepID=A0A4P7C251_9GAMM|nr:UDP-glucuronic acid decarboxylase family protein [Nitrosococcus wardiae]QBQ55737.1 SDR family oxidoreductase [Nitrosococcus wardiae]
MKRVLVTGGAGFLGRHLCARLLQEGCQVFCMDNFYTGSKDNIREFLDYSCFKMIHHDVCLPFYLEVDEIYNLACPASPIHYQRDPVQTLKTNAYGAINMLELAKRLQVKILQASTSEVYGNPQQHPQDEEYWGHVNPIGARSCYDEGKRCAESLFFAYHQQHQLPVKVARIFNTYGPYMQCEDGRVISNFIVQALHHKPITLYGNGSQSRSFCYVTDLIEALFRLMHSPAKITGPINLGNPQELTVLELAQMVRRLTNSRSKIVFRPLPGDDPQRRRPDILRAQELLSWQPRIELEAGLMHTITYFDKLLSHTPQPASYSAQLAMGLESP